MAANKVNPIQAISEAAQAIPGLKNVGPDLAAEFKRQMTQGTMEIASLLFGGNAFVQYGPGQHAPEPDHTHDASHEHQRESDGMER